MLGEPEDPTAVCVAAELFCELWSESGDWCMVEKVVDNWIWEGQRCAEWPQMIFVMDQDVEDCELARRLMGEASVLLGKVYGSLGQLSNWLSAVCTGAGKKFPQMFFPNSHLA